MYNESIGDYMAGLVGTEVGINVLPPLIFKGIFRSNVSLFFTKVEIQFQKMQMPHSDS